MPSPALEGKVCTEQGIDYRSFYADLHYSQYILINDGSERPLDQSSIRSPKGLYNPLHLFAFPIMLPILFGSHKWLSGIECNLRIRRIAAINSSSFNKTFSFLEEHQAKISFQIKSRVMKDKQNTCFLLHPVALKAVLSAGTPNAIQRSNKCSVILVCKIQIPS